MFSDKIHLKTQCKTSGAHHRVITAELEKLLKKYEPTELSSTDVINTLHSISEQFHKRSLVIIFSDMFEKNMDNEDELFSALQHLRHKKHDIILFHVIDKEKGS